MMASVVLVLLLIAGHAVLAKSLFTSRTDIILNLRPVDFVEGGLTKQLVRKELIFVNFHSSSCSHCISHAPKWIQFAEGLRQSGALAAAIDCDEFRDVCSAFSVSGTPAIKVFRDGDLIKEDLNEEPDRLFNVAIKEFKLSVLDGAASNDKGSNLSPKRKQSNEEMPPPPPPEDDPPTKARLRKPTKRKTNLPTSQPTLGATRTTRSNSMSEPTLDATKMHPPGTLAGPTFASKSRLTPKQKVLHDASLSLRYGLEKGVFLGKFSLSASEQKALFDWLDLLRRAFPTQAGRWQLDWLYKRVQALTANDAALTSKGFDTVLEGWAFARRFDESYEWRYCGKYEVSSVSRQEAGMGYTCGMWLLFHIITVSAGRTPHLYKEVDVSSAIHGFIQNFFSCNECRDNFLKHNPLPFQASKSSDPFALALWLWREHNFVSNRLNHEDASSGIVHKRELFPHMAACPTCHKAGADGASAFEEGVVVRYLDFAYSNFEDTEEIPFTTMTPSSEEPFSSVFSLTYQLLGAHWRLIVALVLSLTAYVFLGKARRRIILARWKHSKQ
jgi:thiol-disulfide isomerase/thioredoxin